MVYFVSNQVSVCLPENWLIEEPFFPSCHSGIFRGVSCSSDLRSLTFSRMSSHIYILPGSVCHCFQIKTRPRSTAFMTLEGLSGTFWACWASQYLHFHLPAVRGWLPLVANWWLAIPDQEAQDCGRGPSNILLALNPCLMTCE